MKKILIFALLPIIVCSAGIAGAQTKKQPIAGMVSPQVKTEPKAVLPAKTDTAQSVSTATAVKTAPAVPDVALSSAAQQPQAAPSASFEDLSAAKEFFQLPSPSLIGVLSLEECIAKRRSVRRFQAKDLSIEQISQIAWAAQGITDTKNKLRSVPSAGALYPVEIYVVASSGVFSYIPDGHQLKKISSADQRQNLSDACQGQNCIAQAGISIVITASYGKTAWKYGEKAVRFVDLETGHAAQNILLQAAALDLSAVPVGSVNEPQVKQLLNLPADQKPVYVVPVGYPK